MMDRARQTNPRTSVLIFLKNEMNDRFRKLFACPVSTATTMVVTRIFVYIVTVHLTDRGRVWGREERNLCDYHVVVVWYKISWITLEVRGNFPRQNEEIFYPSLNQKKSFLDKPAQTAAFNRKQEVLQLRHSYIYMYIYACVYYI